MIEYQDIRMEEGRVTTLFFQDVLPTMGFFPSVIYFSLLSIGRWERSPFYRQEESSRGINDPSENYSSKSARLNPCSPRLLRGPSSPSPAMNYR